MSVMETATTFEKALDTMNLALRTNADKTPFRQMMELSKKLVDGLRIGVAIYADDPDTPHDFYTIRFVDGEFEIIQHGKADRDVTWKVSEQYLQDVADNPGRYADNPAKLDWDWLKSRLGM